MSNFLRSEHHWRIYSKMCRATQWQYVTGAYIGGTVTRLRWCAGAEA